MFSYFEKSVRLIKKNKVKVKEVKAVKESK